MKIDEKILNRFQELLNIGEEVLQTKFTVGGQKYKISSRQTSTLPSYNMVNSESSTQWGISCLFLLEKLYGNKSIHYIEFNNNFESFGSKTSYSSAKKALAVLKAAKDDYENGYLFDTRALIEAEVFDDFLEQSEHLLNQGYFTAAAVIAGSVLEDGLRKLCVKNGITLSAKPKLDTMNADLAKAGVYNLLKQKQITALADLRNKAAHGQGGFAKEDVEAMIKDVRRFTADYFS